MESVKIALGSDMSVMIGMPVGSGGLSPQTVLSLFATTQICAKVGVPLLFAMEQSSVVQIGRDAVIADFLETDCKKLFLIDSDMVWTGDDFLRFVALSQNVDVLCAAYPAKVEGPVATFWVNWEPGIKTGEHGLIPIKGVGLGFTIIDRKVIAELAANAVQLTDQITGRVSPAIHRIDIVDGKRRTEDMAFFADITALGYTVWLDPMLTLGHIGQRQWRGRVLDSLVKA